MRIGPAILVFVLAACAGGHARPSSTPTSTAAPTVATMASPASSTSAAATTTLRPTPNGVTADSPCLERAIFGDPAESEYVLPYAVGEEHYLSQSYCFSEGGHRNQLSYDFDMPIGARVLAARDGVVKEIKEDSPDTGLGSGQHNHVFILHNDGTIGFYAHLMLDGVEVEPGDGVSAGDFIAYAGNSGMTAGPHLHFGVYQSWPPREGYDVPVNFCNAFGQHDSRRGLAVWRLFEALPTESC